MQWSRFASSGSFRWFSSSNAARDVVIVSAVRTPIASFGGELASFTAPELGAAAIRGAVERAGVTASDVQEVFMGNVVSSGTGQAPTRQAALYANLHKSTPCTTINKVCASGMKSVMLASSSIAMGAVDCMIAGGMESMSNIPYYLSKARNGYRYGNGEVLDGILIDGLYDAYDRVPMGDFAELCASDHGLTREDQDEYATLSYTRALESAKSGRFRDEIIPISIPQRRGDPVLMTEDEEPKRGKLDKFSTLKPAFKKNGTVTAANASSLNDGAAALVLMTAEKAKRAGLTPLARIRGFSDAAQDPKYFTTAPAIAIPRALRSAGVSQSDVNFWEINEAFSVVSLANNKLLNLDVGTVNVFGGAVALGHPIGCSGARIIVTLLSVLKQMNGTIGCAGICNGGGGASAIVIERLH